MWWKLTLYMVLYVGLSVLLGELVGPYRRARKRHERGQ
jgi:hypothetical protein